MLITIERINTLRLPSIRSKRIETRVWLAEDIQADVLRCGLKGSPTKVMQTFENEQGRRKCTFIRPGEMEEAIKNGVEKSRTKKDVIVSDGPKLKNVWIVGEAPRKMAETISDDITEILVCFGALIDSANGADSKENENYIYDAKKIAELIQEKHPNVVLWGSDRESKEKAAQVAAILQLGLCADCTELETEGVDLFMYRPAFSGNIIAKIRSITRPCMATIRTTQPDKAPIMVGVGAGAKVCIEQVVAFAQSFGGDIVASRVMVDNDYFPYEKQVGLTGKTISPDVYIAIGISGTVHHIAGIRSSGTIIAINNDPKAPIFNYADIGIVCDVEKLLVEKKELINN